MKNKTILICDDSPNIGEKYKRRLDKLRVVKQSFKEVKLLDNIKFRDEFAKLVKRQKSERNRRTEWSDESEFDKAAIVVLDYDLLNWSESNYYVTGELIAYLVRCFSDCALILGLNRYGTNIFDLTLMGHPDSYADLNIGNEQLDNLGLWEDQRGGFRPWYWPNILGWLKDFEIRNREIADDPNAKLFDSLGLDDSYNLLSKNALSYIGSDPKKLTFRSFVLESGNGLKRLDRRPTDKMIGRIAAARVSKWLERFVLPGQDVLVDAPHLVARFPSLLISDGFSRKTLDATTKLDGSPLGINENSIREFEMKPRNWLSRRAWFWPKVVESGKIDEVSEPWFKKQLKYVFCEDSSTFLPRSSAKEFLADVDSPYVTRFVANFSGVEYRPSSRLVRKR